MIWLLPLGGLIGYLAGYVLGHRDGISEGRRAAERDRRFVDHLTKGHESR